MNDKVKQTSMTDTVQDHDRVEFEDLALQPEGDHRPPAQRRDEPAFGQYAPNPVQKVGLAIGRSLPKGRAGLRMAGAARPLALFGVKDIADVEALGLKLRLHPKDNLSEKRLFMTPQCFDPVELAALNAALKPKSTFIDIGANAGAYALFAARHGGPSVRVIAVEPQGEMRARMGFNVQANKLTNVEITGVALSDYEGESVMRMIGHNKGGAALSDGQDNRGEAVRVTMLQTLLDEMKVQTLTAMKIDVEGGEVQILSPFFAKAPKSRWPRMIILERPALNDLDSGHDALALCCSKGYRVRIETRMNAILDLIEG